jgi:hypothetical protein
MLSTEAADYITVRGPVKREAAVRPDRARRRVLSALAVGQIAESFFRGGM